MYVYYMFLNSGNSSFCAAISLRNFSLEAKDNAIELLNSGKYR